MGVTPSRTTLAARAARSQLLLADPETGEPVAFRADAAARYLRAFADAGGIELDAAFWRVEAGALQRVVQVLEESLRKGWGVDRLMADFIHQGRGHDVIRDAWGDWQLASRSQLRLTQFFLRELLRAQKGASAASIAACKRPGTRRRPPSSCGSS